MSDFRVQSFALCNHAVGQGQMVTNSGKFGAESMRLSRERPKTLENVQVFCYIGYRLLAEGSNWKRSADH